MGNQEQPIKSKKEQSVKDQIDDSKLTWHFVSDELPKKEGDYRAAVRMERGWIRDTVYWGGEKWLKGRQEDVIAWGAETVQGELPLS
jgi:hypothetical protein